MMMESTSAPHHHHPTQMIAAAPGSGDTTSSEENTNKSSVAAPAKKRAETWVKEETRTLITLRREIGSLFNTSKSNKHLWEQISLKMREKGFDRSPTMCTDKWRNLLKEFKKAKEHSNGYSANCKMQFYKEVEEIIKDRNKNSKVDSFMHFSDKVKYFFTLALNYIKFALSRAVNTVKDCVEDTSIAFASVEGNARGALNLERGTSSYHHCS
ncbi:hypothetical protein L1987_17142 [Smallanthus sonchifolius]|uniref:Uncharacterized protein n=1 Tax=Smallanthus sonchifolius TaxID=185202 RepID=A0ACB9IWZ0_9ASTR|nr:hypothetical protein L1987_17142 [Smallanthus sonchifolius]